MGDPSEFASPRAPRPSEVAARRARLRQRHRLAAEHEKFLEKVLGPILPPGPTRQAVIVTIVQALSRSDLTIRKAARPQERETP